jgi:bifunctional non-homologous end joining protein LigD
MSLAQYRKKRDFKRTKEPRGNLKRSAKIGGIFVVQKHDASHLHYDFRLEYEGVLRSWAVPKGPSLDPRQKRLAVQVEDHPLEYGSFEGVIPEGEYGGGTVLLWDRGTWKSVGDPAEGFRNGRLKFELHGEKLRGQWMLVRRSSQRSSSKPQWLLFKVRDNESKPESEYRIVDRESLSIATGRDLDEIAASKDRVWHSNGKAARRRTVRPVTKRHRVPRTIELQLPTLVEAAPDGDQWLHEIKFDGYRMLCRIDGETVTFETRNHLDWTSKLPELVEAARHLKLNQAILDGEVVAINEHGITDFQSLQNAFRDQQRDNLVYTVFDLLFLDGVDLRELPLEQRKAELASLKLPTDHGHLRYTDHLVGNGPTVFKQVCKNGGEGIVSKRRDRPYMPGRGTDWVKVKCQQHAEFVIGGYTDPSGSRRGFGALLLGYFENKKFLYAGRVGTGFSDEALAELFARLKPLEHAKSPFDNFQPHAEQLKGVHWVRPKLVAQVRFTNWTRDGLLRHPAFQGLREDKPARLVRREVAKPLPLSRRKESRTSQHKNSPRRKAASTSAVISRNGRNQEITVGGVRMTHPDKILYPDEGITKRELAEYYLAVTEYMLPYVTGRPLAIVRCPDGISGERFFQKHPGPVAPAELRRVKIREKQGVATYMVIDDVKGLPALAQISALEIHVWGSQVEAVEKPDLMVLDLDPAPDVLWQNTIAAAIELGEFLRELGLESFVKTSGGKGLHLCVPLRRTHAWPMVSEFSEQIARAVERAAPDRYVANMSKKKRGGKIFVDYLRNQRGATSVAPYSTRARPGAPLSIPVSWRELRRIKSADQFLLRSIVTRLRSLRRRDPWAGFQDVDQQITKDMMRKLKGL